MNLTLTVGEAPDKGFWDMLDQPIVAGALLAFTGVVLTIIIGTAVNLWLAKRRNEFEKALADRRFALDKELAENKLADEARARTETRREALRFRRADFQRETLIAVQEAILALMRACGEVHGLRKDNLKTGDWKSPDVDDALLEKTRALQAKTLMLQTRIHDQETVEAVKSIKNSCANMIFAPAANLATKNFEDATNKLNPFNDRVGTLMRQLDDLEDTLAIQDPQPAVELTNS